MRLRSGYGLLVSILLAVGLMLASCNSTSGSSSTTPDQETATSSALTSTTTSTPPSTSTTTVTPVDPELAFPLTDTGVATNVRQLTIAELEELELVEVVESPDGARFSLTSCVTTWPNRWEVSGEWTPALEAQAGQTDWILSVAFVRGDVIGGAAVAAVTFAGPGTFTMPMVFDIHTPAWRRARESSHEYRGERPFQAGSPCRLSVTSGPQPVIGEQRESIGSESRFDSPAATHSPGSLQAELEAMTDPSEHWLGALSWHVGLENSLPMDVLYLRPGAKIDWIEITQESTCVGASIVYHDDVVTAQAIGCPPGADPIDRFDADELVEMSDGWLVGVQGIEIEALVAYLWEGADPVETSFDPNRYAADLVLPENRRIVAELDFGDGVVLLIEQKGDPTLFYVEELFTGGGQGYVGGGPGETWQGCWRIDYSAAGYAIVLTQNQGWTVRYDGSYVEMKPAGDVAAALVEGQFDRTPDVEVRPDPDSGC